MSYHRLCLIVAGIFAVSACSNTTTSESPAAHTPQENRAPAASAPRPMQASPAPAMSEASRARAVVSPARVGGAAVQETAQYKQYADNPVKQVAEQPLATFSLDVDTGSYANVRRILNDGRMPPPNAVRVEELINYFPPQGNAGKVLEDSPFAVDYELASSPWDSNKTLLRVNVQAVDIPRTELPPSNLVFLVDVSGSMDFPERLPLLKSALKLLVDQLRPQDKVSLVTYASGTNVVLSPTSGAEKAAISSAIDQLRAGGSTAGASGLKLAYQMAEQGFIKNGVNRILLATDGDFNVGVTSTEELKGMVTRARESGTTLSTLGFGTTNYNESMMMQIADVGNGNYSYIDSLSEAQKVLNEEMSATLVTVAKDVKAQIEFNPAQVLEYRQIGYEKRQLKNEDFNNDSVDAGDIGAGKRVTVLYELTLAGQKPSVDALRYQASKKPPVNAAPDELAYLKLRWKAPQESNSQLVSLPLEKTALRTSFEQASNETRFMAAVAAYGQKLRSNPQLAQTSWTAVEKWAEESRGTDKGGYRAEFVKLVTLAGAMSKQ